MSDRHKSTRRKVVEAAASSRLAKFVFGFLTGMLLGWGAGQFTRFDTGIDLLLHLGGFGLLFGTISALISEEGFLKFLNWFS